MPLQEWHKQRIRQDKHNRKSLIHLGVYKVSRHYGGPEEGGWWYDWHTHVSSTRRMRGSRVNAKREDLKKAYAHLTPKYDRFSVLGGADVVVMIEKYPGQWQDKNRPHYE